MMTATSFNNLLAKFNAVNGVNTTKAVAKAEPKQTESKKATPAEPAKKVAEPKKAEVKTEPVKTEPVKTEPVKTEPVKVTTKSKKTEQKAAPKAEPKQMKLAGGVSVNLVRDEIAKKAANTQQVLVRFFTECLTAEECDEYIKAISGAMTVMKEHKAALKGNTRERIKANVEQFTKVVEQPKKVESKKAETKKATPAEPAKVEQVSKISAKVRKDLGLTLERYIKNDGEPSKMFLLKSTSEDGTRALKDLFKSAEFKNLVHYKVWAKAYSIPEKHLAEFTKLTGIKAC